MIIATATKWILPYSHWEGCVCCLALRENNVRYTYASVWPNGVYFIRKLFLSWANIEQRVLISVRSKLFTVLALTTGVVSCCLKFGAFCVELSCDWRYNPISYEIPTFWLIHSLVLKIILLIWNTALVRFFILTLIPWCHVLFKRWQVKKTLHSDRCMIDRFIQSFSSGICDYVYS